jgi:hypothetical protein
MIFRAILGIGLLLFLMPQRPEAGLALPAFLTSGVGGLARQQEGCGDAGCGPRTLADVKAEIDASLRARGEPFYMFR